MLICHCARVNDQRIREALQSGARTVGQVGRMVGAGTCCGGCVRAIAELVEQMDARATVATIGSGSCSTQQRRPLPVAAE